MAPIKSSLARSVGKLLGVFRDRDLTLNSSVRTNRIPGYIYTLSSGISATGGSATLTPGDGYKYHYFTSTGPNPFNVTGVTGTGYVEYVIIGGGGGGGSDGGGGGGAGGLRTNAGLLRYLDELGPAHPKSSTDASSLVTATVQNYTFTIGTGGSAGTGNETNGANGGSSSAFGLTAAGGGKGTGWGGNSSGATPLNGGSGGGRGSNSGNPGPAPSYPYNPPAFNLGNSPPTSPPQGNPGGMGGAANRAGGGGGAGTGGWSGGPAPDNPTVSSSPLVDPSAPGSHPGAGFGRGGWGVPFGPADAGGGWNVPASYGTSGPAPGRWFAGGGGGGWSPSSSPDGTAIGGYGGGGDGVASGTGGTGSTNTGGGGGGGYEDNGSGGPGGSGIIIVRYII